MTGLILPPGQGRKLITRAQEVTFKATGAQGSSVSVFEVVVPPGFDVGAHVHKESQEFFYVLQGELELLAFEPVDRTGGAWQEWESAEGERAVTAREGACMFVPTGVPHAFRNASAEPARMLFQCYPSPYHERYFEEIAAIWAAGGASVDAQAVAEMRERYDVDQLTPLRYQPPAPQAPAPGGGRPAGREPSLSVQVPPRAAGPSGA